MRFHVLTNTHNPTAMRKTKQTEPKHQTTLRLDPKLFKQAERVAQKTRMSVTSVVETCLEAGIPRLEKLHDDFIKDK